MKLETISHYMSDVLQGHSAPHSQELRSSKGHPSNYQASLSYSDFIFCHISSNVSNKIQLYILFNHISCIKSCTQQQQQQTTILFHY